MADLDHPTDPPGQWQRDHLRRYVHSRGADGHLWNGVPTLLLTTIGRRSGTAHRTPLIYGRHGEEFLIVASKGGSDTHPQWYLNLTANPHVRLMVADEEFDATARTATPAEKAERWPVMTAIWPDYDQYQASTTRDIPVVILTRGHDAT